MAESLDDIVESKESKGFIRKAAKIGFKVGMAAATTALSVSLVGSLGIWVGASFAAGGAIADLARGKSLYETTSKALTTYSAVNAVIHPMVWLGDMTFPLISNNTISGFLLRGAYASTVYNAAFVGSFRAGEHLVDNYLNPKGMVKYVANGFPKKWRDIGLLFSPFYTLAANGITTLPIFGYPMPTFAVGALPVGFALDYFDAFRQKAKQAASSYMPKYSPAMQPA